MKMENFNSGLIQELISKSSRELTFKMDAIIKERLEDYFREKGEDMPALEKEPLRRFSRFLMVHDNTDNSDTYYWNDGSIGGYRIVTFKQTINPLTILNESTKMSVSFDWY